LLCLWIMLASVDFLKTAIMVSCKKKLKENKKAPRFLEPRLLFPYGSPAK